MTAAAFNAKDFKWDTGSDLKPYTSSPSSYNTDQATPGINRFFCGEYGSTLIWHHATGDEINIMVGTIDDIHAAALKITESVLYDWTSRIY